MREVYREVFKPEYWLKDDQGRWHRVPEDLWRPAAVARPTEVCP